MNKEIKDKWVAALRSGNYIQGHGTLSKNNLYCCLGVLCDLAVKEGICKIQPNGLGGESIQYDNNRSFLPDSVMKWAELDDYSPSINGVDLSNINDSGSHTFNDIADLIEKHL